MTDSGLKFYTEVRDYRMRVALWAYRVRGETHEAAGPVQLAFDEVHRYAAPPVEPTLVLDYASAERLMTELWLAGVRPHGYQPTDNADLRRHLEDMRALVAHAGGLILPEQAAQRRGS